MTKQEIIDLIDHCQAQANNTELSTGTRVNYLWMGKQLNRMTVQEVNDAINHGKKNRTRQEHKGRGPFDLLRESKKDTAS